MRTWIADISPNPAPECWLAYINDVGDIVRRQYYGSGTYAIVKVKQAVELMNEIEQERERLAT